MSTLPVIAIDGPAASGKGTLARRIAQALGFAHLDTGTLYRVVGLAALRRGRDPAERSAAVEAAQSFDLSLIEDPDLRSPAASAAAAAAAAIPEVREIIAAFQKNFAANPPGGNGAVIDGRNIGTTICPNAAAKLFVIADVQVRARRRFLELKSHGTSFTEAEVLADIRARDERDMTRTIARLEPAADAHVLDTTHLDIETAVAKALEHIHKRLSR